MSGLVYFIFKLDLFTFLFLESIASDSDIKKLVANAVPESTRKSTSQQNMVSTSLKVKEVVSRL